ncbi:hypothetical protein RJ640_007821 [Escallonia rubra]|uniref:Pentatricopeptide repeat-containing protein n=1 Tax=Escallonia rubra TaxID=112253 RepID=A0AA88UFX5_9ASTE|nr:hypothetical protein RJ640_007821 [Escallonia rubra]
MNLEIAKLVADGLYKQALLLYTQLRNSTSFQPTKFTFPPLLKACAKLKSLDHAQMLHTHVIKTGFQSNTHTATSLTDTYMKLHLLGHALQVFNEIPEPNTTSLNVAITGFAQNGCYKEALRVFRLVGLRGFRPDSVSMASVLSACEDVTLGIQLHCWAVKMGVEGDIYAATSLVTMYSNCAGLVSAAEVFEGIRDKNVVCYNAFITGLLRNGVPQLVLDVFKGIRGSLGVEPNSVTLISVLSACSDLKYIQFGRQVHGYIVKFEMDINTMVGTAIVDMYSKCGSWKWAYDVFGELGGRRNLITWNTMIAGMMLNGQSENAIELFAQLESEGFEPDSATWNSMISGFSQLGKEVEAFMFFRKMLSADIIPSLKSVTSLLPACSAIAALRCGQEIHGHVIRTDISDDQFIATAIIDMYMKCGQPFLARRVFNQFRMKPGDPAIWNAMISGYGRNGENESAFRIFDQMREEKVELNSATFNCILAVCSHTGQVEKGREIYRLMKVDYGLNPTSESYGCMVDLLGRSGNLDEARELLEQVPEPSASVLTSLLGACECYSSSKLGEEMAEKLSKLEPENPIPFVILSNIYARQERWKDAQRAREMINHRRLEKIPGFSMIGVT